MSRIRGKGNKETELTLMELFRCQGITGWRRHAPVFGKPDFAFPKLKVAVFVDGCFWHRCPKHSNLPRNNRPFWKRKLESNVKRDKLVNRTLRALGWHVLRIWQHELARRNEKRLLRRIQRALGKRESGARSQESEEKVANAGSWEWIPVPRLRGDKLRGKDNEAGRTAKGSAERDPSLLSG